MKNLLFLFAFLMTCQWASAQMTEWTWDIYKVKFSAPSDFKVKKNEKAGFSAGNGSIHIDMYPENGANVSYEQMYDAIAAWANKNKLAYEGEPTYMEDLNGYWGCYIDGYAPNNLPTSVLLLIDPDYPEIGLYVWLQYQEDYIDTAVEMLRSFIPN